jgi:lysophospholipase L1-like esterase
MAAVAFALAACAASPPPGPPVTPVTKPVTYVAIGSSDAVGIGITDPLVDAWPQLFYRRALPLSTVYVNLASAQSTAAQAVRDQLPEALSLSPGIVTIELGSTDVFDGVPATTFGSELRLMIDALRSRAATRVLVGNVPPLSELPAYRACLGVSSATGPAFTCPSPTPIPTALDAEVATYNAVISTEVAATDVTLVNLHVAGEAAERNGTAASLVSSDGVDLSTLGQAEFAKAFADAYATSGRAGPRR